MPPSPSRSSKESAPPAQSVKLTGRGAGLLVLSLAAVLGGAFWNEPGAVSLGLLGMLLTGVAWPLARLNLQGLVFERKVPESAFAGQLFPIELMVRNEKKVTGSAAVEYEDGMAGPGERGLYAAWLNAGGGTAARAFSTRMMRRGTAHRVRINCSSTFPLGLWRARREVRDSVRMVIYPRVIPPKELEDPQDQAMLEADESESAKHDWLGDFHGIRQFQPGDRMKLIHWPSTARAGRVMVREFDRRLPEKYLVLFHSIRPGRARGGDPGDAFESAMELLCGLLMKCRDQAVPIELVASFNGWRRVLVPGPELMDQALRLLAEARRQGESDAVELHRALAGVETGARVFVLSDVPLKEWEDLIPELPFAVTCLSVSGLRLKQPMLRAARMPQPEAAPSPAP